MAESGLSAEAANYNGTFAEKAKRWNLLDGYYIPTRYPNGLPDGIPAQVYNQEAAQAAVALAEEAIGYITQQIALLKSGGL